MQVTYQECLDNNGRIALFMLNRTRPEFRGWEWWYVKQLSHSATLTIDPVMPDGGIGLSPQRHLARVAPAYS